MVVEGCDEVIPRRAGVRPGGGSSYTCAAPRGGAPERPTGTRGRRASRVPSAIASHPTLSPSQLSGSRRSATARSVGA